MPKIVSLDGDGFLTGNSKAAYCEALTALDIVLLKHEAITVLQLSLYGSRNPRSDSHWQVLAVEKEFDRRGISSSWKTIYSDVVTSRPSE